MNKIYKTTAIMLLALASYMPAIATTHMVTVNNNFFAPDNINVTVGDTIMWMWGQGFHTTTSTSVPAGAISWDQQINNSAVSFAYVVQVPGVYQYQCNFHSGMVGQFTAITTSVNEQAGALGSMVLSVNPATQQVKINYFLPQSQKVLLTVYNALGNAVYQVNYGTMPQGKNQTQLFLSKLAGGIYFITLKGENVTLTKKIYLT